MIITLIPFLLAAKLESPSLPLWKRGVEVTYFVQSHATTLHSGDSNCMNMDFNLQTLLSCQELNSSLHCHFHNTKVHSTFANVKQPRPLPKYIIEDIWTKKILQQDIIEIEYNKNGRGTTWISSDIELVGRNMILSLVRLLVIGLDMSKQQTGNFESTSNITFGHCKTKFFVTRSSAIANGKNSNMNLFLIPRPDDTLTRPLEIDQKVVDNECIDKYNWYSFFATRELRKVSPKDVKIKLNTAENFIIINNDNFTSFSRIKVYINNQRDDTKYILDESLSLSLIKISNTVCPECKDQNSGSHEN
ncbi:hypothetical protein PV327_008534 [Microctonus hyperodae]|uniref:Vitellogenin domain-containing protein n=1 Tax=Microctonus hyperodae TaxID=165561 RepID=A0AA39KHN8_MICHY|nr:hypothetical protein PV327_008534 [Microctonus hyperodae]